MAALINARDERDGIGGEHVTAEAMADVYNHLQRCNPETDVVVIEADDGTVAGYARVQWNDWEGGVRSYWMVFENDPGRPQIEAELLDWAEARALRRRGRAPGTRTAAPCRGCRRERRARPRSWLEAYVRSATRRSWSARTCPTSPTTCCPTA